MWALFCHVGSAGRVVSAGHVALPAVWALPAMWLWLAEKGNNTHFRCVAWVLVSNSGSAPKGCVRETLVSEHFC